MHDICYSTCRKSKNICDYDFYVCLNKNCSDNFCNEIVNFIFSLVNTYGCKAYLISQILKYFIVIIKSVLFVNEIKVHYVLFQQNPEFLHLII